MNGLNKVFLLGNLGQDPEIKHTTGGTTILRMRIATNERTKKGDEWVDHTEWHTVTAFGKRAEGLAKVLSKGSSVHVEGKLRTRQWDKDGTKFQATEIIADEVTLVGSRPSGGQPAGRPAPQKSEDPFEQYAGDDIPY